MISRRGLITATVSCPLVLSGCINDPTNDDIVITNRRDEKSTLSITISSINVTSKVNNTADRPNSSTIYTDSIILEDSLTLQPQDSDGDEKIYEEVGKGNTVMVRVDVNNIGELEFKFRDNNTDSTTVFIDIYPDSVEYSVGDA